MFDGGSGCGSYQQHFAGDYWPSKDGKRELTVFDVMLVVRKIFSTRLGVAWGCGS